MRTNGFSGFKASLSVSSGAQISGWTIASPFYGNAGFDPATGNFTVPSSGRYSVKATINYSTTLAITGSIGGANPILCCQKNSTNRSNSDQRAVPLTKPERYAAKPESDPGERHGGAGW